MTDKADIARRMRDEARRFNRMHEARERPWLADAAFVADELELAAAEIDRLRAALREIADERGHCGWCGAAAEGGVVGGRCLDDKCRWEPNDPVRTARAALGEDGA